MIEGLGTVLTGLAAVIVALGTVLTQRSKTVRMNERHLRRDLRHKTTQYQVAIRHVSRLEDLLVYAGRDVPARPAELHPDWGVDVDDEPAAEPAPRHLRAEP